MSLGAFRRTRLLGSLLSPILGTLQSCLLFPFPGNHTPTEQEVKTWYAPLAMKMLMEYSEMELQKVHQ